MDQWMDDGQTEEWLDGLKDAWMDKWMDVCLCFCVCELVN